MRIIKTILSQNIFSFITLFLSLVLLVLLLIVKAAFISIVLILLVIVFNAISMISCLYKRNQIKEINKKIKECTDKGINHIIELNFNEIESSDVGRLSYNLNNMLKRIKDIFWKIKDNLSNTKISKSTLDNIQILMVSYIQKVVNIGNVRVQIEAICNRITEATKSTKQMLELIVDLANQTTKEADTIKQTSEALETLFNRISKITEITRKKQKMAEELKYITKTGIDKVGETSQIIHILNKEAGEMLKIIEIINNIAESTNILSINAGIEAAHAGRHGLGFRVIADEITKLVDSTKKNASVISTLLKEQVNKINRALKESNISSDVFKKVIEEVENVAETWVQISKNTEVMSQGTKVIQDTTETMFEITKKVQTSSEAIRQSVEKIGTETVELDEASTKTLDILEKVTITNEEAKNSTVTILQQLGDMSRFVNVLNQSIDFLNLGKKVFFLFSDNNTEYYIRDCIFWEFESYLIENYSKVNNILQKHNNAILFINISNLPQDFILKDFIVSLKKLPSYVNTIIICLLYYDTEHNILKNEPYKDYDNILLIKENPKQNAIEIIQFLEQNKARGLRKHIRVDLEPEDEITVSIIVDNNTLRGEVVNLSSVALLIHFEEDVKLIDFKKHFHFTLYLYGKKYKIQGLKGLIKPNNNYLIIFEEKSNIKIKEIIQEIIYNKLKEKMAKEIP